MIFTDRELLRASIRRAVTSLRVSNPYSDFPSDFAPKIFPWNLLLVRLHLCKTLIETVLLRTIAIQ